MMRLRLPPPLDVVKYQVIIVDFFASVQLILGGLPRIHHLHTVS
jgi:hypothetical protein